MLKSLIYVSVHKLTAEALTYQLTEIVTVSKRKNASVNVSGALIATDRYFSQVLQGPGAGVDGLMLAINRDQRHHDVTVIENMPIKRRRCPDWKLAYVGSAGYINRQISLVIDDLGVEQSNHDYECVLRMMREFCRP